jgi:hypothetical protein
VEEAAHALLVCFRRSFIPKNGGADMCKNIRSNGS